MGGAIVGKEQTGVLKYKTHQIDYVVKSVLFDLMGIKTQNSDPHESHVDQYNRFSSVSAKLADKNFKTGLYEHTFQPDSVIPTLRTGTIDLYHLLPLNPSRIDILCYGNSI